MCHEPKDEIHERSVRHAVLGTAVHDGLFADELRKHLAELVAPVRTLPPLRVERIGVCSVTDRQRAVNDLCSQSPFASA